MTWRITLTIVVTAFFVVAPCVLPWGSVVLLGFALLCGAAACALGWAGGYDLAEMSRAEGGPDAGDITHPVVLITILGLAALACAYAAGMPS